MVCGCSQTQVVIEMYIKRLDRKFFIKLGANPASFNLYHVCGDNAQVCQRVKM